MHSLHTFERDRVLLWLADTTINRAGDDNGFVFILRRAVGMEDVGHFFGMRFAYGAAAEAAGGVGGAFTVPTFHSIGGDVPGAVTTDIIQ